MFKFTMSVFEDTNTKLLNTFKTDNNEHPYNMEYPTYLNFVFHSRLTLIYSRNDTEYNGAHN